MKDQPIRRLRPDEMEAHYQDAQEPTTPEMVAKVMNMVLQGVLLIVALGALAVSALLMAALVFAVMGALFGNA